MVVVSELAVNSTGYLAFHFCTSPQTLTLNHQISNGASLSELNTCMLNGGWLLMADYWSYVCRFRFSIFNYGWELIFRCTIILKVTIYTYFCAHGPGRIADWRLKLVWWRERARQRRDAETEDEWEARLRQWRERDSHRQRQAALDSNSLNTFTLYSNWHMSSHFAYACALASHMIITWTHDWSAQCSSLLHSHNWVSLKLAPWWLSSV